MTAIAKLIPTSSQTVGPYFRIGLDQLIERSEPQHSNSGCIAVHGQVFDRDGAPVPDAMLEFWSAADAAQGSPADTSRPEFPLGFARASTDLDGSFSLVIRRPASLALDDGHAQAPHLLVLVFARGLLRHLISRVYLEDEAGNAADPLLNEIPPDRRSTLIAQLENDRAGSYRWNVVLQGRNETVFFAW